jgi:hypothetical protein
MKDASPAPAVGSSGDELDTDLLKHILGALGVEGTIPLTLDGLATVYGAWCRRVPFDNIRKMISIHAGDPGPRGGLDAADFFANWLEHGTGGTCWPSSNALCVLLSSLGFEARRVAGSMFDLDVINHGTVKIRIDGADWLADTSMLTNLPLPTHGDLYIGGADGISAEVERVDDSHVIWADFVPMPVYVPCRLHFDPVGADFYEERYEIFSRAQSPFNGRLYFRVGGPAGARVILGNVRFSRVQGELVMEELSREGLCEQLRSAGVSERMLERWISAGALDMSFDPANIPPTPEVAGVRPSLRHAEPALD